MINKHTAKKTRLGKSVLAGAMAAAFLMAGASVFAEGIENRKVSSGYVTIEGELTRGTKGASVTLLVANSDIDFTDEQEWLNVSGDEVSYYQEVTLGTDKIYSFKFMLTNPGIYNVYLVSKAEGIEKAKLIYIDEEKSNGVITDALPASKVDSDTLKLSMENKLSDLGVFEFGTEDFDDTAASVLASEIKDLEAIETDEMIVLTEKSILVSKIKNGTLNSFYDYPEASFLNDTIFNHCTEDIAEEVVDNMGTEISDISEFDTLLMKSTILTLANQKDGATLLKNALDEYKEELGITREITTQMCEDIIKAPSFSSYDTLKVAIENYSGNGGGNGGSNGGSNGGNNSGKNNINIGNISGIVSPGGNVNTNKPSEIYPFNDIQNVEWAVDAITKLYKEKIINGKAEGLFYPMEKVTRAEFAKILMLAFDVKLVDEECPFTDVSPEEWSYPYIRSAYLAGIVNGIDDVTFGKDRNITRQDLCVMVYRLLTTANAELLNSENTCDFNDSHKISGYALNAVGFMQKNGIINGDDQGRFNPFSPATRAEAAKIVYNAMNLYGKTN